MFGLRRKWEASWLGTFDTTINLGTSTIWRGCVCIYGVVFDMHRIKYKATILMLRVQSTSQAS